MSKKSNLNEISANLLANFLQLQKIAHENGEVDIRELPEYDRLLSEARGFLSTSDKARTSVESQQKTPSVEITRDLGKNIFRQLRDAVRNGTAREQFPVGTEIPDVWWYDSTTKLSAPLIVVNYGVVNTPEGDKEAVTLLRKYVACKKPFDTDYKTKFPESELAHWLATDYMEGCSSALREVIQKSEIFCDLGVPYMTFWFTPSLEELHFNDSSEAWEYFRDAPTKHLLSHKKRTFTDASGELQNVWLRSRSTSSRVCIVNPGGLVNLIGPSFSCGVLPACVIY